MLQAKLVAPGKIEFEEAGVPSIGPDEVLIEVKRIGVCGSDIHVFRGEHPFTSYPVIQGHEVAATVVQVGRSVGGLKTGDLVTLEPSVTCGECYLCRHGRYNICEDLKVMGFQVDGAARELMKISAKNVEKLPSTFDYETAAMVEPLAVAVHAAGRLGSSEGKSVLVLGAGPIGNLVAQVCRAQGAARVMITDYNEYRLGAAGRCGIAKTVNVSSLDVAQEYKNYFGPDKADAIIECVGLEETLRQAVSLARKGSTIVCVGVFAGPAKLNVELIQDRELQILGTLMYQRPDYTEAIRLLIERKVNLSPLITNHVAFRDYARAYQIIEEGKGKVMKVIVDVAGGKS